MAALRGASASPGRDAAPLSSRAARDSSWVPGDTLAWTLIPRGALRAPGNELLRPAGVTADPFGGVVVADAARHRVLRFDPAGTFLGEAGSLGSGEGQLRRPGAVVTLGSLDVAVLDRENRRVVSYDRFGGLIGISIDLQSPSLEDQIGRVDPIDMKSDRGGALFVADAERDRLLAFDFAGRYLRSIGGHGGRSGSFRGLAGIAVDREGGLVVAERSGARVQRLEAGGQPLAWWPLAVVGARGALPVAVDDSLRIAVADEVAGVLWIFDRSGRLLASGSGLASPRALAFAPDGTLLVAESGAGRVLRFELAVAAGRK